MAKRKIDAHLQSTPLTGIVRTLGTHPSLSVKDLAARVADLTITLTGGRAGSPAIATFSVVLNIAVAANETAELIDEALASRGTPATRMAKGYVFKNVKFTEPGQAAARVFRITNIRANATTLSGGSAAGATPVVASISISGSTPSPLRLSDARQVVALVPSKAITK